MLVNELLVGKPVAQTVLAVIHKPQYLKLFDRIIMLNKGEIQDAGRHEELLARNEEYRNILNCYENELNKQVV